MIQKILHSKIIALSVKLNNNFSFSTAGILRIHQRTNFGVVQQFFEVAFFVDVENKKKEIEGNEDVCCVSLL